MDLGKVVRTISVPEPKPVEQPIPIPDDWPKRKEDPIPVEGWPVRVPEKAPAEAD